MWKDSFWDRLVYFSFDKTGFHRHRSQFNEETLEGSRKHVVVTGGTSGLGLSAAETFVEAGCDVTLLCRNLEKAERVRASLLKDHPNAVVEIVACDVGQPKSVLETVRDSELLKRPVQMLVNNAGAMPDECSRPVEEAEEVFSSQVFGHFCLTLALLRSGSLGKGSRVIFVSSGGMYTKRLDLSDLGFTHTPYSKYTAYTNAKRAQVILAEMFATRYPDVTFSSMHPGWADTPGVRKAMPWFYAWTKNRLRTPAEGADTIVWLALTDTAYESGRFWFDRRSVSPYWYKYTEEPAEDRERLWGLCEAVMNRYQP
eukprot:Rmarinus@m.7408